LLHKYVKFNALPKVAELNLNMSHKSWNKIKLHWSTTHITI